MRMVNLQSLLVINLNTLLVASGRVSDIDLYIGLMLVSGIFHYLQTFACHIADPLQPTFMIHGAGCRLNDWYGSYQ